MKRNFPSSSLLLCNECLVQEEGYLECHTNDRHEEECSMQEERYIECQTDDMHEEKYLKCEVAHK